MTNREKYSEKILDIALSGGSVAIDKNGKFNKCGHIPCSDCAFKRVSSDDEPCNVKIKEWSEKEYVEPPVDWTNVPVDTKVYVRDFCGEAWLPMYFARFEDGKILTWTYGATSFSADNLNDVSKWNQGKLAEDTV